MSSTKNGLDLGKTSVEKSVDYEFSQREQQQKYTSVKEQPILDYKEDLVSYFTDQIDELKDKAESAGGDRKKELLLKIEFLTELIAEINSYYDTYSGLEIDRSKYSLSSPQKYLYEVLHSALQLEQLVAIPDKLGDYNGMRLYSSRPIEPLKGLKLQDDDLLLESLPTTQQCHLAGFLDNAFIGLLKYPEWYSRPEKFKLWEGNWQVFVNPLMNPVTNFRNTKLYAQIDREINSKPPQTVEDWRVAIDCGIYPHLSSQSNVPLAIVPLERWFPPQVKALKASDIVALFPPAELEVLMLIIGRGLIGPSNSIPCGYEQGLKHNHRTAAIMIGRPGTGKSELIDLLEESMGHFGFLVQPVREFGERFGVGELTKAALVVKDDNSDEDMSKILNSSAFKTFITGGLLCAEKKHKDATFKRARGAVILASNQFNPNNAYQIDDGVQSRLRLLATIDATSRDRLLEELPDGHLWKGCQNLSPDKLMKHLEQKLGVDRLVIFAWFLRLCAVKFYEAIPNLPEIDKTLETRLQNRIPADLLYITVKALKFSLLLRGDNPQDRVTPEMVHRALEGLCCLLHDHRTGKALNVLKQDWEARGRQPEHLWSAIRELRYDGVEEAYKESGNYLSGGNFTISGKDSKALENYVKEIFSNLVTWGSIKISPSPAQLAAAWTSIPISDLKTIQDKVAEFVPAKIFDVTTERLSWKWYKPSMTPADIKKAREEVNAEYERELRLYRK